MRGFVALPIVKVSRATLGFGAKKFFHVLVPRSRSSASYRCLLRCAAVEFRGERIKTRRWRCTNRKTLVKWNVLAQSRLEFCKNVLCTRAKMCRKRKFWRLSQKLRRIRIFEIVLPQRTKRFSFVKTHEALALSFAVLHGPFTRFIEVCYDFKRGYSINEQIFILFLCNKCNFVLLWGSSAWKTNIKPQVTQFNHAQILVRVEILPLWMNG